MRFASFSFAIFAALGAAALGIVSGCGPDREAASTGLSTQPTHAWGSYHWARTSNPFTLKLGDNVSSAWDSYLGTASADWSRSRVLDTTIVAGGSTRNCRPTSGRVEVCSNAYGYNGWLGLAQIWVSGSHITQGAVRVNDSYFNTTTYDKPGWRSLVMCQEVGHTLGLGHQDEDFNNPPISPHTCMDYFRPGDTEIVGPNKHDYEQLADIYSHLDSTTTVGAAPAPGSGLDTPDQWGELVSTSHDGHRSIFVRSFGGGSAVVTFVTWASQ
jgi:hypothetical protein